MHIFVGCFVYVVDFMILEDLGSIIDNGLSEVVLGKPFAQTSKLTYDESLGLIRFSHKDDEVVFRMPQRTKELDLVSPLEKDKFEAFFMESLKVRKIGFKHIIEKRKGYYNACMNLGHSYKRDRETIEKLKTNHISIIKLQGEVTQNRRDLPRDIPLESVVVLRYEKRSKSENKGRVPTEMELVLEQTQQGTSYEVSVRAKGVEELKRKVKIKGEKKEALLTLRFSRWWQQLDEDDSDS
ncbi:hypothetical protein Tco_0670415 [Tanacetum coccineum]